MSILIKSILIKNMAMPTKCSECNFSVNGFTDEAPVWECACEATETSTSLVDDKGKPFDFKPDWCPLVEVQEQHWIPVTKEPQEDDDYLATLDCEKDSFVDIVSYDSVQGWGFYPDDGDEFLPIANVIAWMPSVRNL